ncbi:hypothetical protein GFS24_12740 [Chitinophaga sp. SYP-B3965]|uniref:hypothetical protein n=1 Tax=Chitinophaga sp. SYP-B3965 TaxID=2663120 RepID=UPI001299EBC6|nr:hypothetical protein [Chitinophaga sp. SYP-B3965]MRG45988.1 hypothetical protein [Chitinophaga sp. SYP-B3965]
MKQTVRRIIVVVILLSAITATKAQERVPPVLPDFSALIKTGKIQLDWISGFPNAVQIGIQRSLDSVLNFTTIGYASSPGESRNAYMDNKPLPGKNYYRLFILFSNNRYMHSKVVLAVEDSTISADAKLNASDIANLSQGQTGATKKEETIPWKPSNYIYTTADGNVNIRLPEAMKKKYGVKFYEPTGVFLFEVDHVQEPFLIIEKAIFMHAGWFNFEIFEEGKLLEKWNLFIPLSYK